MERNVIHVGRSEEVLKSFPANSVDAVATDPPYGLGTKEPTVEEIVAYLRGERLDTGGDFLGADWDIPSVALWKEVFRVLKPGGFVAAFAGTRTWDLMALGLRAAGFECRDTFAAQYGPSMLAWVHSMGFPKSVNIAKQLEEKGADPELVKKWEGYGTSLKPAWEPILLFRKPLEGETLVANVKQFGAGGMNIKGTRVKHSSEADFEAHKASVDAVKSSGGKFRGSWKNSSDLSGANEVTYEGRWPPNVGLCHSDFCRKVGEKTLPAPVINRFTDGMKPFGEGAGHEYETHGQGKQETIPVYECHAACPVRILNLQSNLPKNPEEPFKDDGLGASKYYPSFQPLDAPFKYNAKTNQKEASTDGLIPNDHPTKKPISLMKWLVRLVSPSGGLVLDPFCGSGSTGVAAIEEGFDFVGIEMDPHFANDIARPRLLHHLGLRNEETDLKDVFSLAFGDTP